MLYDKEKLEAVLKHYNFANVIRHNVPATGYIELSFRRKGKKIKTGNFSVTRETNETLARVNLPVKKARHLIINRGSYLGVYGMLEECFTPAPDKIYNGVVTFSIDLCNGEVCDACWENYVEVKR